MSSVLLSTAYFGPIQYYTRFLLYDTIVLETKENYSRQSYRNRCNIYGANGKLVLSVPVLKGTADKIQITDVKIDYNKNWQKLHWKGIESAYRSSPFFEYFHDDFVGFYTKKWPFLFEFNLEILKTVLKILDLKPEINFTRDYSRSGDKNIVDMRERIHPKRSFQDDRDFFPVTYTQVFSDKQGFIGNLSIVDLIFNAGPDAVRILQDSIKSPEFPGDLRRSD